MPSSSTTLIPLCVPEIQGNEWHYIKECLDTGWISSGGDFVERFERIVADYVGVDYAIATVSGTAALHTALMVAGIEPDDEVLVSDLTFVAPANAIRYLGAWPVFMDAELDHWQIDVQKTIDFLEQECCWNNGELRNIKSHRRIRAVLPVHVLGHPVDMDPILNFAAKYGLVVIEDASESLGAKYRKSSVGGIGNIACFSFNANKIVSTGGGGMIVTNNEIWAEKARYLTMQAKDDPVEYIHKEVGYNYRLTNILAAMGVAQMERIAEHIDAKKRIATIYKEKLARVEGLEFQTEAHEAEATWWLFSVLVDEEKYGMGSRALMSKLQEAAIQSRPLWCPMHMLEPFSDCQAYMVDVAQRLYREGLGLPSSVGLCRDEQERVINAIVENSKLGLTKSDR